MTARPRALRTAAYFMTTTTAQAAEVMSRLEFLLQTAWPELARPGGIPDRRVGGDGRRRPPGARGAGAGTAGAWTSPMRRCPSWAASRSMPGGMPLRVLRLSFSGELAFELYVPAGHAAGAVGAPAGTRGESLGIKPYGLESLASLRIEKGHVAGLELDHRNTLDDLGLGKMARPSKPFVGRELRERLELRAPQRWSLVGLECLDAAEPPARRRDSLCSRRPRRRPRPRLHHLGHLVDRAEASSSRSRCTRAALRTWARRSSAPIRSRVRRCAPAIVSPVFVDPAGERLRV